MGSLYRLHISKGFQLTQEFEEALMDRILRIPEVVEITGLSRTTIWRRVKSRRLPRARQAWQSRNALSRLARDPGQGVA